MVLLCSIGVPDSTLITTPYKKLVVVQIKCDRNYDSPAWLVACTDYVRDRGFIMIID